MKKWLFLIFLLLGTTINRPVSAQDTETPVLDYSELSNRINNGLILKVENNSYSLSKSDIEKWLTEKTTLNYSPTYVSEIETNDFCAYLKSPACLLTFSLKNASHVEKFSEVALDENAIKNYVADIARQANRDASDARFKMEDGKVSAFSLSDKGIKLKEDESVKTILSFLQGKANDTNINLPYDELTPQIGIDSVDNLGITSLVGEGTSDFRGSPKNRIFNIKVATSRFNGILIKPGEEFSFVKVLGEVDGEHGYLPELVIKKDKTEPEFGGGICQVSTTAFRAAIYSGLEITARRNHAYPVSYYNPQGMDSTVYVPRPDLKFINNTPGYILIQTKIEGTKLTFDFYGTDDGRKTNVIGPTILEKNPDGSMKTTFTQQVYDKDGKLIREDEFKSSYDSPSKYPHPTTTTSVLTKKPDGWSDREWKNYKKANGIN